MPILCRNWGWLALRGVMALLFGLFTFFEPGVGLAALVLVFGAYALVDGVFAVTTALANRRDEPRWVALLIGGIAGIVVGIVTLALPGLTAIALVYWIAAWAIVTGVAEIAAAINLRKVITGEWMLALAGVLSIAFGMLIALFPGAGALALVLWIGAYAILFGVMLIALALRLRRWNAGGVVVRAA